MGQSSDGDQEGDQDAARRTRQRLLIVEDEDDVRSAFARLLKGTCEIDLAASCAEAHQLLLRFGAPIGLVIDFQLPDGSGLEVVERARTLDPALPSLMVTGHLNAPLAALAFGMDVTFLPKPVVAEPILRFARRCLVRPTTIQNKIVLRSDDWVTRFRLTETECELLVATARGVSRDDFMLARGIAETTLKRHVTNLLEKLAETSLDRAALRFLREVLRDD